MRRIVPTDPKQPIQWELETAAESIVIGTGATYGDREGRHMFWQPRSATNPEPTTHDETEYAARVRKYGPLLIGEKVVEFAERGFATIRDNNITYNGISASAADVCLKVIQSARNRPQIPIEHDSSMTSVEITNSTVLSKTSVV